MDIQTTKGVMDDSLLEKREGSESTDEETVNWIEFWLTGELIHRSVHVIKKTGIALEGFTADLV